VFFNLRKIKDKTPWQIKFAVKLAFARFPFAKNVLSYIGLYRHGGMDMPEYALERFLNHFNRTEFSGKENGFIQLELGPGDSLFSALAGYSFGCAGTLLVDVGRYARMDVKLYREMMAYLSSKNLPVPEINEARNAEEIIQKLNSKYLTEGLKSIRSIPSESVDFIWSNVVLEHIRRDEFLETMKELRRILRKGGACSHTVDLRDHLGFSHNNLRFSSEFWERNLIYSSGFYTNRLRYSEMIELFQAAGFYVNIINASYWDKPPVPKSKLHKNFRTLSDDELRVSSFNVVLR
jgi:SAM-dependent methyltransferase